NTETGRGFFSIFASQSAFNQGVLTVPGARRWNPSDEPFSYTKLCYFTPILVFGVVLLISVFEGDEWLPSSAALNVAIVSAIALAVYLFFLKVVWRLLPAG